MNNFTFYNPTRLLFGEGMIAQLAKHIPAGKSIMVTFGGGSVKENGVYEQVIDALQGHNYIEFWGIESNPDVATLRKAVALGKEKKVDFLLAVGGGSVLDGTKLIAAAIPYEGDAWELVLAGKPLADVIPLATVLTIPATGSEMNNGAVISNRELGVKYPFFSQFPLFSILDPTVTYTLPDYQIACGFADTFVHVMEQYLTKTDESMLMDNWNESILRTLIQLAPKAKENKSDYKVMSEFMLCATMALNGFTAMGTTVDWATHMIGHELTAIHGITHGESLAIVYLGTMRTMYEKKHDKILQYGERIWGISSGVFSSRFEKTVEKTEAFFKQLGLCTTLTEAGVTDETIEEIVRRFEERNAAYGEDGDVTAEVAREILNNCKEKNLESVVLVACENVTQAHLIQGVLENEGIHSMIQNELMSTMMPYVTSMGAQVVVSKSDYKAAKAIVSKGFPDEVIL